MMKDTTPILLHFGSVVKELRREKLLSQEELANRCGLHRTYITDIEHGTRNVSLKNISKIASAVEVSLHEVFARVEHLSQGGSKVSEAVLQPERMPRPPVEILLIDDDEENVELTMHGLEKWNIGNKVHIAGSGEDAIQYIFNETSGEHNSLPYPLVVLLSLKLPSMSGLELLEKIRKERRTKDTPVIVLITSVSEAEKVRYQKLGVEEFLTKPINIESFSLSMHKVGFQFFLLGNKGISG